jgi:hypothetical protein
MSALTDVSEREGDIQPARVQSVYGDLRVYCTIDDVSVFVLQLRNDKPGGNQDDTALAGHPGNAVDHIFDRAQRQAAFLLARAQYTGTEGGYGRLDTYARRALKVTLFAIKRLLDSNLSGLRIVPVDDEISLVVTDLRAIKLKTARDGAGLQTKQCVVQLCAIIGKVQDGKARGSEDGGAIRGPQRSKVAFRSLADMGEIAELQVDIVEHVSYKTLGSRSRVHRIGRHIAGRNIAGVLDRLLARLRGDGSGLFHFELGDDLRLAFVEDLKVLLVKIPYGVPLRVADNGAHNHQSYVHLECGGLIVSGDFRGVLFDFRLWG